MDNITVPRRALLSRVKREDDEKQKLNAENLLVVNHSFETYLGYTKFGAYIYSNCQIKCRLNTKDH